MGGLEDNEPPLKRVKESPRESTAYSLGDQLARSLSSKRDEEMVGSKGVIRKQVMACMVSLDCLASVDGSLTSPMTCPLPTPLPTPVDVNRPHSMPSCSNGGRMKINEDSKNSKTMTQLQRAKRRRKSAAAANEHIGIVGDTSKRMLSISEGECDSTGHGNGFPSYTFHDAFLVLEKLVKDGLIKDESNFWCFAVTKLGEDVAREQFMSMRKDSQRIVWLRWAYAKEDNQPPASPPATQTAA